MAASLLLSWREGVTLEDGPAGGLRVAGAPGSIDLRSLAPEVAEALRRLEPPGAAEDQLADLVLGGGATDALAGWYYCVQGLARRGFITRTLEADGHPLARLLPISSGFELAPVPAAPAGQFVLSRFTYLRREGAALVLESPRAHARIVLDGSRSAALIVALSTPGSVPDLAERVAGIPADAVGLFLGLLASVGMVRPVGSEWSTDEEDSPPLATWEFHDLLFHARSRRGRTDAPFGGTFRMAGRFEPPPAIAPGQAVDGIDLPRPDLSRLEGEDPPLTWVLEQRRSLREYGPRPLTADQLGEFLFRVARVKGTYEWEMETPRGPVRMAFAPRPYPAGGAMYELEVYAAIQACEGLDPGLYHYDALNHRLGRRPARPADFRRLIGDAAASASIPAERVQVLLVLAARFPRIAWKYASIAYALTLKHVGVLYQTMYLTATAMGLAPCALGGGDSDVFARAAGTEYEAETSVGEFLLGSRPGPAPEAGPGD